MNLNRTKTSIHLSDTVTARVHDLPASVIDSLVLSASMSSIQRLSRHRAAVSEAWKAVEEVMHRTKVETVEELDAKLPELDDRDWETLQQWMKRNGEMADAFERFKLIYRMGREQADAKLAGMNKISTLNRKIAFENPSLYQRIQADSNDENETAEMAEALLPHLLQLTVESGDSGMTEVRFCFKEELTSEGIAENLNRVRLKPALVDSWIEAIACHSRLNEGIAFKLSDGLTCQNGTTSLLVADEFEVNGTAAIHEYFYPLDVQVGHLKKATPKKKRNWIRSLKKTGGNAEFKTLLAKGILVPVLPEMHANSSPLQSLASLVSRIDSPEARRLRRSFLLLEVLVDKMGSSNLSSLPVLQEKAVRSVKRIHRILPVQLTGRLAFHDWFTYEQTCNENPIALTESIRKDLEAHVKQLDVTVVRSHVVDMIAGWFVEMYGSGGECQDVMGFLSHCSSRLGAKEQMRIAEEDAKQAVVNFGTPEPISPSEINPHDTVVFRVAALSEQALKRGDYQILADCRQGLSGSEEEKWVRELLPDAEPLWFSYGTGWGSGKNRYQGRHLLWPTARQFGGKANHFLPMADLKIVHDPKTDTLVILGPEGNPAAPIYTGNMPVHHLPECVRLFLKLSDPWVRIKNAQGGRRKPGYTTRKTDGRVVTAPAEWRIPVKDFPMREMMEAEPDYFLRLHDWRVREGIPKEAMFAVVDSKYPTATCKSGKERYIHFGSPRLIERFARTLEKGDLLIFTEVFPERGAHAIGRSGQPCVTEFRVAAKWV